MLVCFYALCEHPAGLCHRKKIFGGGYGLDVNILIKKGYRFRPISLPEGGLSLGRHQMNDVVLKDRKCALFQGRIYFDGNNRLCLINFTKDGYITVDDVPVHLVALQKGQIIRLGATTLRVENTKRSRIRKRNKVAMPQLLPAEPCSTQRLSSKKRGMILFVCALLLGAGTYFFKEDLTLLIFPPVEAAPSLTLNYVKEASLLMMYQQLRGDHKHMVRYSLELHKNGWLHVQVYDLLTDHIIEREIHLPEEEVEHLAEQVLKSGFFKAPIDSASVYSPQREFSILNIILEQDGKYHEAKVFNQIMPVYVKSVVQYIEGLAAEKLGVPIIWNMSEKELLKAMAIDGEPLDADASQPNAHFKRMHASFRQLCDADAYLQTLDPCPLGEEVLKAQEYVLLKLKQ